MQQAANQFVLDTYLTAAKDDDEWLLIGFAQPYASFTVDVGIESSYGGPSGFQIVVAVDRAAKDGTGITAYVLGGTTEGARFETRNGAFQVMYRVAEHSHVGTFYYLKITKDLIACADGDDGKDCRGSHARVRLAVSALGVDAVADPEFDATEYAAAVKAAMATGAAATATTPATTEELCPEAGLLRTVADTNDHAKSDICWISSGTATGGKTCKGICQANDLEDAPVGEWAASVHGVTSTLIALRNKFCGSFGLGEAANDDKLEQVFPACLSGNNQMYTLNHAEHIEDAFTVDFAYTSAYGKTEDRAIQRTCPCT